MILMIYSNFNIECIEVTFVVLKFDKSNDINELQSLDMLSILVMFGVLKLDKSNDINELQWLKMLSILEIFIVLKFDKSNDINDLHASTSLPYVLYFKY